MCLDILRIRLHLFLPEVLGYQRLISGGICQTSYFLPRNFQISQGKPQDTFTFSLLILIQDEIGVSTLIGWHICLKN